MEQISGQDLYSYNNLFGLRCSVFPDDEILFTLNATLSRFVDHNRVNIWWIKRDFRLADNPALTAALEGGAAVLPVFLFEPTQHKCQKDQT